VKHENAGLGEIR